MQDSDQIVVAAAGHVRVANLADAPSLPGATDGPTSAVSDFLDLGYSTENGCTFTVTPDVTDINAWQSATPVRRLVNSRIAAVATELLQYEQETFSVAFGGGQWSSPSAGVYRYDPPADTDALSEFALVIDFADGDRNFRIVLKRSTVTDAVETQLVRTGPAILPVTWNALTPDDEDRAWYFVSDDESAFALAS